MIIGLVEFLGKLNADEIDVYEFLTMGVELNSVEDLYKLILKSTEYNNTDYVEINERLLGLSERYSYLEVLSILHSILLKCLVCYGSRVEYGFKLREADKQYTVKLVDNVSNDVHVITFNNMGHIQDDGDDEYFGNYHTDRAVFKHINISYADGVFGIMNLSYGNGFTIYDVDFDDVILFWFNLKGEDGSAGEMLPLGCFDKLRMPFNQRYDWDYVKATLAKRKEYKPIQVKEVGDFDFDF